MNAYMQDTRLNQEDMYMDRVAKMSKIMLVSPTVLAYCMRSVKHRITKTNTKQVAEN